MSAKYDVAGETGMPWNRDFLPRKPDQGEYGYVKGRKLISCNKEQLIELCKSTGYGSSEVTLACFAAVAGIVAFDLVDSAAHLGGLLAGLGLGALVHDPKRLGASRVFRIVGYVSIAVLITGAGFAIVLMFRPAPKHDARAGQCCERVGQALPLTSIDVGSR